MLERWVLKRLVGIALIISSSLLLTQANEFRSLLSQTYFDLLIGLVNGIFLVLLATLGLCFLLIGILLLCPRRLRETILVSCVGRLLKLDLLMIKRG